MGDQFEQTHGISNKELEPIPVEFGLRGVTSLLSRDNGTDWIGFGVKDLPIERANPSLYLFEIDRDGKGLINNFNKGNGDLKPLDQRKVDYVSGVKIGDRIANIVFANATCGDTALLYGIPPRSGRAFLHIEEKFLPDSQQNDLLSSGYPIITAARPDDGALLFRDWSRNPILDHAKERFAKIRKVDKSLFEPVTVGRQSLLWDDKHILADDELVEHIAGAYLKLRSNLSESNSRVNLPGTLSDGRVLDNRKRASVAQALQHMLGRHVNWHTEDVGMDMFFPLTLGFGNRLDKIRTENSLLSIKAIAQTKKFIKEAFGLPWPQAHQEWTRLKGKL